MCYINMYAQGLVEDGNVDVRSVHTRAMDFNEIITQESVNFSVSVIIVLLLSSHCETYSILHIIPNDFLNLDIPNDWATSWYVEV